MNIKTKPIIKLCGGKSRLLPILSHHFPKDLNSKEYIYLEPFLGGGSVLLYLLSNNLIKAENCYVNDGNADIANLYWLVKEAPQYFLEICKEYQDPSLETFKTVKTKFNSPEYLSYLISSYKEVHHHRAAMFLYLNKTCFNGLCRYNNSGLFNSPWGKYKNPRILDEENILKFSQVLKSINLNPHGGEDFDTYTKRTVEALGEKKIFIYFDPPYIPISLTSSFTKYTRKDFSIYDHLRLRNLLDFLNERGHKFLLSNSYCGLTKDLFRGYNIKTLYNNRSISASSRSRGFVKELVIKNY